MALVGSDGLIDWWCVPNLDSAPPFDRRLAGDDGGRLSIAGVTSGRLPWSELARATLGNRPQALSHLALVHAALAIQQS